MSATLNEGPGIQISSVSDEKSGSNDSKSNEILNVEDDNEQGTFAGSSGSYVDENSIPNKTWIVEDPLLPNKNQLADSYRDLRSVDRSKYEREFEILKAERNQLYRLSIQLQHQVSPLLSKKANDNKPGGPDQESRYLRQLLYLCEQINEEDAAQAKFDETMKSLTSRINELEEKSNNNLNEYIRILQENFAKAKDSKSGASPNKYDVDTYVSKLKQKLVEINNIRIKHIRITNSIKEKENLFKGDEGIEKKREMLDFEHLKIENQTFQDKLGERNEEILRLRLKISSTVQILSHIKEKIHYLSDEYETKKALNKKADNEIIRLREDLGKLKRSREDHRKTYKNLVRELGLMNHTELLEDYDANTDVSESLSKEIKVLIEKQKETQHKIELEDRKLVQKLKNEQSGEIQDVIQ